MPPNLETLSSEQKRLALQAVNARARVEATVHDPRYAITL